MSGGVAVTGTGVHSGARVVVRLHRYDGPTAFLSGGVTVPADVLHVVATPRCTVLGIGSTTVATVEHLLAALCVAGFWRGVMIEVDGPELPILDGSSRPWAEAVAALGAPPEPPTPLTLARRVRVAHEGATLEARPGARHLEVLVRFPEPIGTGSWAGEAARWDELLDARTFAFRDEITAMRALGLAQGAAPGCGVVFTTHGPEDPLRSPDEPVRHKALDVVGDLALLGRPIDGAVRVERGSHAAHVALVRRLRALAAPDGEATDAGPAARS